MRWGEVDGGRLTCSDGRIPSVELLESEDFVDVDYLLTCISVGDEIVFVTFEEGEVRNWK